MYAPDPGGVFTSDVHRRVLGHLPLPGDSPQALDDLAVRLDPDPHTPIGKDDITALTAVLDELHDENYITETKDGYRMSKAGLTALTGPIANEPPPVEEDE